MSSLKSVVTHACAISILMIAATLRADENLKNIHAESIIPAHVAGLKFRVPKRDFVTMRSDIREGKDFSGRPTGMFFEKLRHGIFDKAGYFFGEGKRPYKDQLVAIALSGRVPSKKTARYLESILAKCVKEWGTDYKKFTTVDYLGRKIPMLVWETDDRVIVVDYVPRRTAKSQNKPSTFGVRIVLPLFYREAYLVQTKLQPPMSEDEWMFEDLVTGLNKK